MKAVTLTRQELVLVDFLWCFPLIESICVQVSHWEHFFPIIPAARECRVSSAAMRAVPLRLFAAGAGEKETTNSQCLAGKTPKSTPPPQLVHIFRVDLFT